MEPTDIQLMLSAREGDVSAFGELVVRYREPLRRYFAALITDRSQADDFVQDTFLRLWLTRGRYEPTGRFSTYLFQIGKHHWLNQRKKFRFEVGTGSADDAHKIEAPHTVQPEIIVLQKLRHARVRRAIASLPEHYGEVFRLSQFDGLKYSEIAACLGIPIGTVKSRMAEAVRRLREMLSAEGEGE